MNFFIYLRVGLLAATLCLLFSSDSFAGVPDPNWVAQTTQADCTGAGAQKPGANPGPPDDVCQSYDQDLYENLEATGNGFCDSDIANYTVGGDPDFYYFEWDMVGDWNNCNGDMVGEGHNYYIAIEIIRDNTGTNVSDNRPDYYIESHYKQGDHVDSGNLNNWIAEFENNVKAFIDTDMPPDAGGPNPLTSDNPSPADGMDTELQTSDSDDAYLRISTNFNPLLAIRASLIGNPTEIRTRAIVFQSSSLGGDKFPWHDHQPTSDLPGQNFDTVCAIGSNCLNSTPITLSYFNAESAGGSVNFSWSTGTEAGNAGFNLYAQGDGGKEKLNTEIIQSSVGDSLVRTDYSYSAESGAEIFYISDIDILGKETFHGPFTINTEYGSREAADPIKWAEIKKESSGKQEIREVIKKSKAKKQIKAITHSRAY